MHIVITGRAGFLGARLAHPLLASGQLALRGRPPLRITSITLVDRAAPPADLAADSRKKPHLEPFSGSNQTVAQSI